MVPELVVTAQKRSENVRDVPLSISVLTGDQLAKQHVANYADLARSTPGLSFSNTGSSGLSRISLRGISSAQGSATVGVYLNDVSLTIPNQFFTGVTLPRLFDLDHVEVLRGPQARSMAIARWAARCASSPRRRFWAFLRARLRRKAPRPTRVARTTSWKA
ncbi:TonB-dependent receptor plug domain-containing protein [Caulobacter segnis]